MRRTVTGSLIAIVLVMTGCTSTGDGPAPAPMATGPTLTMTMARASHTATLLADGRVLIAGGCIEDGCGGTPNGGRSEFYEPASRTFVPGPQMVQPRVGHTATLLADGRVLYAGGWPDEGRPPLSSVEVFDPARGSFMEVGAMAKRRGGHSATRLRDGRVLIVGGDDDQAPQSTVEIFDPATNRFSNGPALPELRAAHAATLLADGRVLVVGGRSEPGHGRGIMGSAVVYDAVANRWSPVGDMHVVRYKTALVGLPDGSAYVLGGQTADDPGTRLATTERFDPSVSAFVPGPTMTEPRYKISDAVVVLRDGRVVIAGGFGVDVLSGSSVRRLDPEPAAASRIERLFPTATELGDGTVLVTGGYTERTRVTATAMLVRP